MGPKGQHLCIRHGAKMKQCRHKGCDKQVQNGGVCITHGAMVKRCSHEGCTNGAVNGGVCITHGTKVKRCSHGGCDNKVISREEFVSLQPRGVHTLFPKERKLQKAWCEFSSHSPEQSGIPPQIPNGCTALTAVAIAGGRVGEISVCNLQMNISFAAACQSSCLHPSVTKPNFSDKEEIGAWIYKTSCFARRKIAQGICLL